MSSNTEKSYSSNDTGVAGKNKHARQHQSSTSSKKISNKSSFRKNQNNNKKLNDSVVTKKNGKTKRWGPVMDQMPDDTNGQKRSRNAHSTDQLDHVPKKPKTTQNSSKTNNKFLARKNNKQDNDNKATTDTAWALRHEPEPIHADTTVTKDALFRRILEIKNSKRIGKIRANDKNELKSGFYVGRGSLSKRMGKANRQPQWLDLLITGPKAREIAFELTEGVHNAHHIKHSLKNGGLEKIKEHSLKLFTETKGDPNSGLGFTKKDVQAYGTRKA